ncbi:Lactate utilization protein B [compost metagenome]
MLTPSLNKNIAEWDDIANASSLCGACYEACPVKIPLHDMLVYLRRRKVESGHGNKIESLGMQGFAAVMGNSSKFGGVLRLGKLGQKLVVRGGVIKTKLGPLKGWNTYRVTPSLPKQSFRDSWMTLDQELKESLRPMDPAMQSRMEELVRRREQEQKKGKGGHGHG